MNHFQRFDNDENDEEVPPDSDLGRVLTPILEDTPGDGWEWAEILEALSLPQHRRTEHHCVEHRRALAATWFQLWDKASYIQETLTGNPTTLQQYVELRDQHVELRNQQLQGPLGTTRPGLPLKARHSLTPSSLGRLLSPLRIEWRRHHRNDPAKLMMDAPSPRHMLKHLRSGNPILLGVQMPNGHATLVVGYALCDRRGSTARDPRGISDALLVYDPNLDGSAFSQYRLFDRDDQAVRAADVFDDFYKSESSTANDAANNAALHEMREQLAGWLIEEHAAGGLPGLNPFQLAVIPVAALYPQFADCVVPQKGRTFEWIATGFVRLPEAFADFVREASHQRRERQA